MEAFVEPKRSSFIVVPVLHFLTGQPYDNLAKDLLSAVRPSWIRVCEYNGDVKTDARCGRVTVYLKEDGVSIARIEQEVSVGLDHGNWEHGYAMSCELHRRGIFL